MHFIIREVFLYDICVFYFTANKKAIFERAYILLMDYYSSLSAYFNDENCDIYLKL